jgi:hypothetical protein
MYGPVSLYYSYKTWLSERIFDFAAEVAFRVAEKRVQHKKRQLLEEAESESESENDSNSDSDSDSTSDEDCPFSEGELADEALCLIDDVMYGTRDEDPVCRYAINNLLKKNPAALGYVSIYCRERIHALRMELVEQADADEAAIATFIHRTSLLGEWLWHSEEAARWPYAWSTHAWIAGSNRHWIREVYDAKMTMQNSEPAETLAGDGEVAVGGEPVGDAAA